jgi:protease-4
LPNAAAAAVDDATAIFTNPAGLGAVSGIELGAGYSNRFFGVGFDHATDGIIAASGPLGTVAAGFSMSSPALGRGRLVTSIGGGLQLDESILVGVALHSVDGELPTVDLGTQLRLSRGLAVGLVGENLATDNGAFRLGVSVRPLDELLTLGVDARFKPAPFDNPGQALLGGAFTPALTARLHLGGVVVGIAGEVQNLGGLSPVTGTATALLQVDLDHMGVALQGGADGIAADVTGSVVGVRGRLSTTAWESLLPEGGRWLELRLADDGGVVDDDDSLFDALFGSTPSALQVLAMLDNAAEDESVEGVMLRLEGLSLGFGAAAELRGAIQRLRENGKKVAVYMVSGDDIDAWVASAADRVWIAPSGGLGVDGVRGRLIYLADVLGRLGITAEAVSAGKYKSAPRTFTHTEPSEEEIEVENALLDGAYNALVAGLAEGRDKSPDEIKAIIDLGGLSASEALEHGMVDALAYNDEVGQLLAELAGRPGERVGTEARFYEDAKKLNRWGGAASIAVIPIEGTIQMGRSQGGLFGGSGAGADDVVDAINRAKNDDDVVAIVLRINSPGGDALASDLMWRAAMLARDVKPVIASMGDVAASGGYYVAAAANTIVAEPNTITGSIGVFGLMFNAEGLVNDLGIRSVEFQRGARPGPDLFRGMTDVERERLQHSVDATYERFLTAIVEGRGEDRITKDALREIAEGRVWTGAQAKERALVDEEGSIIDALRIARERAGLTSTDDLALSVYTKDGGIPIVGALGGMMAMALGLPTGESLQRAANLLFGDADLVEMAVSAEGKPLVLAPAITVR